MISEPDGTAGQLREGLADRYRLEREIGRGGMATVYLAHDLRHDRPVALKVLHPEMARALGPERFHQEIRVTARLRHPGILPLFDSGDAAGTLYYVMPLVEGESLRARMDREPLGLEEALRIVEEVAGALEYAHQHGVIHRDIKPENILLENGHALVADFGIARAVTQGDTRLTQIGLSLGTPTYMSPEQAGGDPDADGRSDLYALACVLYEMLAGKPPFTGTTPEAILVQRFTRPAPRVSATCPGVPLGVETALLRAMAREPEGRFDTVARFAEALRSPASGPGTPEQQSIAVLPFACMSTEADTEYFGDGMAEEIINALTQLPGLKVAARTSSFSFKGKNEDLRVIADKLSVRNVLEGSFRRAGNRIRVTAQLIEAATGYHLWSEKYDRELNDIFAIQDEIATGIADKLKVTLGTGKAGLVNPGTRNVEAYDLYLRGKLASRHRGTELLKAERLFEESIAVDPDFALAHAGLAQCLVLSAFWGIRRPEEVWAKALAASAAAIEAGPELPEAYQAVGLTALTMEFDREKALRAFDHAVELDPHNPDSRSLRGVFGYTYATSQPERAEADHRIAIDHDPQSAYACISMAMSVAFARRYEPALPFARRAVELDPGSLYAHWALMLANALLGRHDEVLEQSRTVSARFGRHPWILMAVSIAAERAGRRDTALAVYHELKGRAALEYVQGVVLAVAASAAGHRDEAYEQLRVAAAQHDTLIAALVQFWPGLDAMRNSDAYKDLLREVGWDDAITPGDSR